MRNPKPETVGAIKPPYTEKKLNGKAVSVLDRVIEDIEGIVYGAGFNIQKARATKINDKFHIKISGDIK